LESDKCPTYAGEEEWIQEQIEDKAIKRITGEQERIPYYD